VAIDLSLIRPRGRHRLTHWGRVVVYVRFHLYYAGRRVFIPLTFAAVGGFLTGWGIAIMQAVNL
jgi:hypothetical protein